MSTYRIVKDKKYDIFVLQKLIVTDDKGRGYWENISSGTTFDLLKNYLDDIKKDKSMYKVLHEEKF